MKKYNKEDKKEYYSGFFICIAMIVIYSLSIYNCKKRNYIDDYCYEQKGTYEDIIKHIKDIELRYNVEFDTNTIAIIRDKYATQCDSLCVKIWLHEHLYATKNGPRRSIQSNDLSAITVNGEMIEEHSWLSHHRFDLGIIIFHSLGLIALIIFRKKICSVKETEKS